MTRAELLELIANGENPKVEFKRERGKILDLAKELVAFLNHAGGKVIVGVDDDGSIHGIDNSSDLEEWMMTACRNKIRPPLNPTFELFRNVEGDKSIVIINVLPGYCVHSLWHNSKQNYLIRFGTHCREASPEELARLFQQRSAVRAELQPISGTSIADLDMRRLKNYFDYIRQQDVPSIDLRA